MDLQECIGSPAFIIKPDGEVLSYSNALQNTDNDLVRQMYEDDKNVFEWIDENSRRLLKQAIQDIRRTHKRQELQLTFINSLAQNDVSLMWYASDTLCFIIRMQSLLSSELNHLRNESSLFGNVLDCLPVATTLKDAQNANRYLSFNRQAVHLLGGTKKTGIAHSVKSLPMEIQESIHQSDAEVLEKGTCNTIMAGTFASGEERVFDVRKVLVRNEEGKPVWIVSCVWDVSEKIVQQRAIQDSAQQLEAARMHVEASNRVKEMFIRNITHELRPPLSALAGFASLMVNSTNEVERDDIARIISNNCETLIAEIDGMVELNKIEAGEIRLYPTESDISLLVNECVAEGRWLDRPQLKYTTKLPRTSYRACIDRSQVRVVLRQLISNAIKFTDAGSVEVGYEAFNDHICFRVSDTGNGLRQEDCERAFLRFEKLGSARPGIGLGLSLARDLVELMGGKIRLSSQQGVGTIAEFDIPCHPVEAPSDESTTFSRLWEQMQTNHKTMRI